MAGSSATGKVIDTGDQINVNGTVTAITGTGSSALVTVKTNNNTSFVAQARDCYAPQGAPGSPAISASGEPFDVGSSVTVMGEILSVQGQDNQALLTVKFLNSKTTATSVQSTAAHSSHGHSK